MDMNGKMKAVVPWWLIFFILLGLLFSFPPQLLISEDPLKLEERALNRLERALSLIDDVIDDLESVESTSQNGDIQEIISEAKDVEALIEDAADKLKKAIKLRKGQEKK